jgi:predicted TIM-barrel fold metal-dependent hydrolase
MKALTDCQPKPKEPQMELPTIYNCHTHTLTAAHLPRNYPPPWVKALMFFKPSRKILIFLAIQVGNIFSFFKLFVPGLNLPSTALSYNSLVRYERFFETGAAQKQEDVFKKTRLHYPKNTRFIVLPMDMAFMGMDKPVVELKEQLEELAELRNQYHDTVIPFFAADPRRPEMLDLFHEFIDIHKFKGVKIYPNLGYYPDNTKLIEMYHICEDKKIPIMAHCSPGGVSLHKASKDEVRKFGNPANYKEILKDFPKLNFCLGHFGGAEEWELSLSGKSNVHGKDASWLAVISRMICDNKFNNLFTDVSYTLFCETPSHRPFIYFDLLKVMLMDETLNKQVLFGSDYYMVEQEKISEKEVSVALRSRLGDDMYFQIAHHNPKRYLYETADVSPKKPRKKYASKPVRRSKYLT